MKLGTYYDEHYVLRYKSLSPSTVQGYESSYRLHVEPEWADWEMPEIRVVHINAWLASGFAGNPGGAEKAYKMLRQVLRSAMGDECYPDDVVDPTTRGVRLPRMPWRGEPQHLSPAQTKALLGARAGGEYEPVALCGLWLGLRRSEQCGLQLRDVDLKTGIVHIRRGLQYVGREVVVTEVKTHRSLRPHMLPRVAVEHLRQIKRALRPKPSDWLLGEDPNPDRYARRLKARCRRLGVACVAPKYFRHTFRINSGRAGVPEQDIQKMLGHKEFSATYLYMSLDEDVLRADLRAHERLILRA